MRMHPPPPHHAPTGCTIVWLHIFMKSLTGSYSRCTSLRQQIISAKIATPANSGHSIIIYATSPSPQYPYPREFQAKQRRQRTTHTILQFKANLFYQVINDAIHCIWNALTDCIWITNIRENEILESISFLDRQIGSSELQSALMKTNQIQICIQIFTWLCIKHLIF